MKSSEKFGGFIFLLYICNRFKLNILKMEKKMVKKYAIYQIKGGIPQEIDTLFYFDSYEETEEYLMRHYKYEDGYYTIMPVYYSIIL